MNHIQDEPGRFYLGQAYDLAHHQPLDRPVYYATADLTTHAVILGMTGSGKTGLGIVLLEEAALNGIPALVIDPKGDMPNLLLTFPDFKSSDFAPWVDADQARRRGLDVDTYAASVSEQWRQGLASTGQSPERVSRLRAAAEFAIYTPGSSAGRGLSILHSLRAPRLAWDIDPEPIRDRIEATVSALLGLVGIQADPVRSREHLLLSNILMAAWQQGHDLDLSQLVIQVQRPPFARVGVFPLDTFYPEGDRMALAMLLNGLMASPTFAGWMEGDAMDIAQLLRTPDGKPRVSIIYLAHLSEAERQFFLTLLLEQVIAWMRAQSGTTGLRALLYMDELFGTMPPHPANPSTKKPLLTLLKQARASGLGLVLATQNPVDLDYKALTNAGTWFIGRLQAERDKLRLLDGLEGIQAGTAGPGRAELDRLISTLQARVFLLHNVHAGPPDASSPRVFRTRWALSYLHGPLTRAQLRTLVGTPQPDSPPDESPATPVYPVDGEQQPLRAETVRAGIPPGAGPALVPPLPYHRLPPQLPSSVKQLFVPLTMAAGEGLAAMARAGHPLPGPGAPGDTHLVYEPALLGLGTVRFPHAASRQAHTEQFVYLVPLAGREDTITWAGHEVALDTGSLANQPEAGALFADLPPTMGEAKRYLVLKKEFEDYLYYNLSITLWYNRPLKLYSAPTETRRAFVRRLREAARRARDAEAQDVGARLDGQREKLQDRLEREEQELEEDAIEYDARKKEEFLSGAESVLDFFTGRRMRRSVSTASRKRRLTRQARADVEESEEEIERLESEIEALEEEHATAIQSLTEEWVARIDDLEEIEVRPRRADVRVGLFALAWLPAWIMPTAGQIVRWPAHGINLD
ncbi:MAG: DUF87 domain-containing protein [Anaerolineae bacterium]|nr:DUF87 domain-containing protein [Anaerolineae bacterium]